MKHKGLYEQLIEYSKDGNYPMHMPGHKRQISLLRGADPFSVDITEITDFDNLHDAKGIIKDSMENASDYYGTDKTWFLINGSSCGILTAISAVTKYGDNIIIGRNCHKSVYHAVQLKNLNVEYLYPGYLKEWGINGGYNPEELEKILEGAAVRQKKIKAVVITSPTYDGIVSDVQRIAEIVHEYGAVLIVDEAHGAHFGMSEGLPAPAYRLGADIVIESLHKTLPALTQCALLHFCGDRVHVEDIEEYLAIYQTSSPSYLFMASIDWCIGEIQTNGKKKAEKLLITLDKFRERVDKLKQIHIPGKECIGRENIFDIDMTKLVIAVEGIDGKKLADILRERYHFEMEMSTAGYALAITTICDNLKEIDRLAENLAEMDSMLTGICKKNCMEKKAFFLPRNKKIYTVCEAKGKETEQICFGNSEQKVSAEYLYLYPPEIPLIVPGEVISKELLNQIQVFQKMKLNLSGPKAIEKNQIRVIKQ